MIRSATENEGRGNGDDMTETQTETPVEQSVPGRTRWGVFLAILAVPALVVAALIYWLLTSIFSYFQGRLEKRLGRGYVRDGGPHGH